MTNNDHNSMAEITENSLLHLYMRKISIGRVIPTNQRNEILVKFLKLKLKQQRYKSIKRDVKQLIHYSRGKGNDLEMKICELNTLTSDFKKNNDLQRFFDLLSKLEAEYEFSSHLSKESQKREAEVVYIIQDHLENCFNYSGQQIAPVSLLMESKRCTNLVAAITAIGLFEPELKEFKESTSEAHIILHPLGRNVQLAS